MLRILDRLGREYGLNQRVLAENDCHRICEAESISVHFEPMAWSGLYLMRRKRPQILVNSALAGAHRLIVLWHEIAHHFLHAPQMCFYQRGSLDKAEREANMLAAIALVPLPLLETVTMGEIQEEHGYPGDLLELRQKIYERLKI